MWCEIRVQGHLDDGWSLWFEGLGLTRSESGETVLRGDLADQTALHGVLIKVRDLGLPLLDVHCAEASPDGSGRNTPTGGGAGSSGASSDLRRVRGED